MERRGQDPPALSLSPAQTRAQGATRATGSWYFPRGKEICKEEVVESEVAVAESRQTDLQKDKLMGTAGV